MEWSKPIKSETSFDYAQDDTMFLICFDYTQDDKLEEVSLNYRLHLLAHACRV